MYVKLDNYYFLKHMQVMEDLTYTNSGSNFLESKSSNYDTQNYSAQDDS